MKKSMFWLFCSILLIVPITSFAKKVTCSNGNYSATIEIDKEKLRVNDTALIKAISEYNNITVEYQTNEKEILEINDTGIIKAIKEGNVIIKAIIRFLNEENEIGMCSLDLPIEIMSNDSSLKSLTLEELNISSIFHPDKFEYEIRVPHKFEKINIIAKANNDNAKITGDGRRYLNEGENSYEIVVTAADGTTSTYKMVIIRDAANDDASLSNLIVEGYVLTPKFNKDIYKYNLNVGKDVEEIAINANPSYELATVSGTGTFTLASGINNFFVIVTAENGSNVKYEVEINRNNGSSKLNSLEIKGLNFNGFDKNTFIYEVTVKNNVNFLDVKAETIDNDQIEIIGNENFRVGKNEIIIRVTGKDKSTTTYKIIVNKLSVDEEKKMEKNNILLKILLVTFIISIIIMVTFIIIFLKRNFNRNANVKKINKNKGKNRRK